MVQYKLVRPLALIMALFSIILAFEQWTQADYDGTMLFLVFAVQLIVLHDINKLREQMR